MFVIRNLEEWTRCCIEIFTESTDQPSNSEITKAFGNAYDVIWRLGQCKTLFKRRSRPNTDAIRLVDEVLQALRDDHGGMSPEDLLRFWYERRCRMHRDRRIFATPEEKRAMVATWERWNDRDKLKERFWAFMSGEPGDDITPRRFLSEEHSLQIIQCLRDWLEKRKVGQAY
ncbi:hypothetical protein GX50_08718 [[Emmonsia] crescens]|uniref:Uncharacterized protein n=1 Tax=[Emmonsia] crescens TaxID=73230 RepID=A0A2B7Z6U9_9EURO|nr:hypothetical protein GX50_08718 [Emmonsia crescens]